MNGRRFTLALAAIVTSSLLFPLSSAGSTCLIAGSINAVPNTLPSCSDSWQYTLSMTWDTGTQIGLSHLDLLIAHQGDGCDCPSLDQALNWLSPIGTSTGVPDNCPVAFEGFLNCNGDPSLGITDLLLKLDPIESDVCQPGPTGQGTFTFSSNYPPAPISEPNLFLVDKFGQFVCYGLLTGVFPGVPCGPTATEARSWGSQKTSYR